MAANSKIEWCDHTFNPWIGCSKVSPACDFCYAEAMMDHRYGRVEWGGKRVRTSASNWKQPLAWNRAAEKAGKPATVFCLSLGDIWDKEADPAWRRDALALMDETPWLIWLLLSKRIGNAVRLCYDLGRGLPANAAIGATVVNQHEWDRDAAKLRYTKNYLGAKFSFASIEPMLGPINISNDAPDWIICGGESGANARPMHPDWVRALRDQCAAADVPFFFKQWGEWAPLDDVSGKRQITHLLETGEEVAEHDCAANSDNRLTRVGKPRAGRLLDGVEHNGMPEIEAPRQSREAA